MLSWICSSSIRSITRSTTSSGSSRSTVVVICVTVGSSSPGPIANDDVGYRRLTKSVSSATACWRAGSSVCIYSSFMMSHLLGTAGLAGSSGCAAGHERPEPRSPSPDCYSPLRNNPRYGGGHGRLNNCSVHQLTNATGVLQHACDAGAIGTDDVKGCEWQIM